MLPIFKEIFINVPYSCVWHFAVFKVLPLSLSPSTHTHTHTHTTHINKLVGICKYTLIYVCVCVCVCVWRRREPFSVEIKIKQTVFQLCNIVAVEHRKE